MRFEKRDIVVYKHVRYVVVDFTNCVDCEFLFNRKACSVMPECKGSGFSFKVASLLDELLNTIMFKKVYML